MTKGGGEDWGAGREEKGKRERGEEDTPQDGKKQTE